MAIMKRGRFTTLIIALFGLVHSNKSYLLLQGLAPQDLVAVHRRQSEQIPRQLPEVVGEPEPSCAELRAMWRHMTRMARHSEITNEIPQLPNMYGYSMSTPIRQGGYRRNSYQSRYSPFIGSEFGKIIREPNRNQGRISRSRTRSLERSRPRSDGFIGSFNLPMGSPRTSAELPGRFADLPMPKANLGMYGTVVHSPEEKARLERDRMMMKQRARQMLFSGGLGFQEPSLAVRPTTSRVTNDIGTFGRFTSDEDNSLKSKFKYGNVVNNYGTTPSRDSEYVIVPAVADVNGEAFEFRAKPVERQKGSCKRLEGKMCKRRDDCYCSRSQLQCVAGVCRRDFAPSKVFTDQWGSWHSGPLDSSDLGISRLKRETTRTIVM